MNYLFERGFALFSNIFNSQSMQEEELIEAAYEASPAAPAEAGAPAVPAKARGLKKASKKKRQPKPEYKVEKRLADKPIPVNIEERGSQRIKSLSTATIVENKTEKLLRVTHKNKRGKEKTWDYPLISEDGLEKAIRDNMTREGRKTLNPTYLASLFPATFWSAALYLDSDLGRIEAYLRDDLKIPTGARGRRH